MLLKGPPDAEPPQDSDLRPRAYRLSDESNAYHVMREMEAKLRLEPGEAKILIDQVESDAPDFAAIEPLGARNAELVELLAVFSRRAGFADPAASDLSRYGFETPIPQFQALAVAARLGALRAAVLVRDGRSGQALEDALLVADAGQLLLRSEPTLVASLVGMMIRDMGIRRAREAIASGRLDRAALSAGLKRLSALRGAAPALQSGLRFEYLTSSNLVDKIPTGIAKAPAGRWYYRFAASSRYLLQPERTRAVFADRFRVVIREAAKPCRLASVPRFEPVPPDLAAGNFVGQTVLNVAMPEFEKLFDKRCRSDLLAAAASAEAAAAAYRIDNKNRFPTRLKDLVPRYLAEEPLDPYTLQPLRYSPKTGAIIESPS